MQNWHLKQDHTHYSTGLQAWGFFPLKTSAQCYVLTKGAHCVEWTKSYTQQRIKKWEEDALISCYTLSLLHSQKSTKVLSLKKMSSTRLLFIFNELLVKWAASLLGSSTLQSKYAANNRLHVASTAPVSMQCAERKQPGEIRRSFAPY